MLAGGIKVEVWRIGPEISLNQYPFVFIGIKAVRPGARCDVVLSEVVRDTLGRKGETYARCDRQ